jgi:hypothetical protein
MRQDLALSFTAVFVLALGLGYGIGSMGTTGSSDYVEDTSFTANASNPVQKVSFDGRNISLIVQPAKNASFFMDVNGTVEPLEGILHDGEVHELRDFVTVDGKMYLLSMRYNDNAEESGDEWITIYRIREL